MSTPYLQDRLGYALDLAEDHPALDPERRHDFVFLFDATNCNPNGDPDNDNMPRQDFETRTGIVSGPCLKRKLRDFMASAFGTGHENTTETMNLYVKHRGLLKNEHRAVAERMGKGTTDENQRNMRRYFWDVRLFGAVLSVGKEDAAEGTDMEGLVDPGAPGETPPPKVDAKKGKVKKEDVLNGGQCVGPVTIGMAETVEPVAPGLMSIVRDARVDNPPGSEETSKAVSAMPGNLPWMPYGLYCGTGHYTPNLEPDRLVTREDLAILWNGLRRMFESDVSAARPAGSIRALAAWVFTHDHRLGNYPVHRLFDRVSVRRSAESLETGLPARTYRDYSVVLASPPLPPGVTLTELYNDWA